MFKVDVTKADFVQPGEKIKVLNDEFTVPVTDDLYAVVTAELYGNNEIQSDMLSFLLQHYTGTVDVRVEKLNNGHDGLALLFSASKEEFQKARQEKLDKAAGKIPAEPVALEVAPTAQVPAQSTASVLGATGPGTDATRDPQVKSVA